MKRAVASTFSGPRGRGKAAAIAVLTALVLTLVLAGCGSYGPQGAGTGSQLDQQARGAATTGATGTARGASTTPAVSGNEPVLAGYTADQCMADMTARYGSGSVAEHVCSQVHQDFGAGTPAAQLGMALTQTESKLGVKPVAGQPPAANVTPGSGGAPAGGAPPGGSASPGGGTPPAGGSPGGASSGWDNGGVVITVPGPAGP